MNKTDIITLDINQLVPAEWNYKTDGTDEQVQKLANSIEKDNSAGIPAVRELDDKYEVIDGNHRLKALHLLKWEKVQCENFGKISKADAILISKRRNHIWFEEDTIKYAELFKNEVLPTYTIDDLVTYMPDTKDELEGLSKLLDFNWEQFNKPDTDTNDEFGVSINIKTTQDVYNNWLELKKRMKEILGYDNDSKVFEFAIIETLNIPEESLK